MNERRLYRILTDYFDRYHDSTAHLSLSSVIAQICSAETDRAMRLRMINTLRLLAADDALPRLCPSLLTSTEEVFDEVADHLDELGSLSDPVNSQRVLAACREAMVTVSNDESLPNPSHIAIKARLLSGLPV
jgi:hypothetical protein